MTFRLHTLQFYKLSYHINYGRMYNYQSRVIVMAIKSNQTRSFQVYCHYAIKAGLELFINASLVGYPYILMRWF